MKNHGHVVVEQVEFELPYHASWPPPLLQSFMAGDQLDRKVLPEKLRAFAARAWRRPLDKGMVAYLDGVLAEEFATGATELEALRNALAVVLSDPKFMYLARMGTDARARNHELVSRLAFFLWNGPPDAKLLALADQPKPVSYTHLRAPRDRTRSRMPSSA